MLFSQDREELCSPHPISHPQNTYLLAHNNIYFGTYSLVTQCLVALKAFHPNANYSKFTYPYSLDHLHRVTRAIRTPIRPPIMLSNIRQRVYRPSHTYLTSYTTYTRCYTTRNTTFYNTFISYLIYTTRSITLFKHIYIVL